MITKETDLPTAIVMLCLGDDEAMDACSRLCAGVARHDPDDLEAVGPIAPLLKLEVLGVYAHRISVLVDVICEGSVSRALALLRAWQFDLAHLHAERIQRLIDNAIDAERAGNQAYLSKLHYISMNARVEVMRWFPRFK